MKTFHRPWVRGAMLAAAAVLASVLAACATPAMQEAAVSPSGKLFAALRPGGHYVIVDHSALPATGAAAGKTLHRIDEAFVIAEVRRAGFVLESEGAFLRDAADPRDTPPGEAKPEPRG